MKTFTDTAGRVWEISANLGSLERVKTSCDVDLLTITSTQKCLEQMADVYTLGRVLYTLCGPQAEARGMPPEKFAEGFNADVLSAALDAVVQEVIFFCRKELQPGLLKVWTRAIEADRKTVAAVATAVEKAADRMQEEIDRMTISIDSATSSRESSGSTRNRGRSDNSSGRRRPPAANTGTTQAIS